MLSYWHSILVTSRLVVTMITLATLPEASLQDIFNQVRNHLLKQNQKSTLQKPDRTSPCYAYRGKNGTMCAVGCLIADEEYKLEMDHQSLTSIGMLQQIGLFPLLDNKKYNLLSCLQWLHDSYEPNKWEEKLLEVAIEFDLEWV